MKKTKIITGAFCVTLLSSAGTMAAQNTETIVVEETTVETVSTVDCKTHYSSSWRDNWFIQLGAGINVPLVEKYLPEGNAKEHITANYNLAVGKWMSPYLGWRLSANYGSLHWDNQNFSKAKYANLNFDLMWDMFNSIGGVNPKRVFSIVPFVGLGGTYAWDFKSDGSNVMANNGKVRHNSWTLPVSAGLQLRFRMSKYADFFVEGRAQFYGDNFNNCVYGRPVDINIAAIGGFTFYLGGVNFEKYNPCDNLAQIAALNDQVNEMRGALAATSAALAAAEAQLPCPEVKSTPVKQSATPLLSTVRFTINSAYITPEEEVNVYNMAEWLKSNPNTNIVIRGYADKDTGTESYNMELSQRRAQAVADLLTNRYGISKSRLTIEAKGSSTQAYSENDWNRIVIFATPK